MTLFRATVTLDAASLSEAWVLLSDLPESFAPETLADWAHVQDFKLEEVGGTKAVTAVFATDRPKPTGPTYRGAAEPVPTTTREGF